MLGDTFGRLAADDRLEKFEELGSAAGEVAALLEEVADGCGYGVRLGKIDGLAHFFPGAAKGRGGGHGPGKGIGAPCGGRGGVVHGVEGGGDGRAQGGEDIGPSLLENSEQARFGAGREGWFWRLWLASASR